MEELIDCDQDNTTILRDFNETYFEHEWSPFMCNGPSHMPTFKVFLYLNNDRYEGCGTSKKRAKISAITKFKSSNFNSSIVSDTSKTNKRKCTESPTEISTLKKLAVDSNNLTVPQTSAISIIHEIFAGQPIVYDQEESHGLLETISVTVSGNKYIGYGKNKKEAKEIACRNALKALFAEQPIDNKFKNQIEMLRTDYNDSKIIDHFAQITDTIYQQLEFENIKNKEYSVIASIIKVNF